ncbi:uncharacterized protein LOC143555265 [Bidens hawaiensis]|uniref:uncharacterized protein LOC143555265 n=1 Tax=Bidens hawaiensis TaxID=980011 RepID=UPI0040492689
MNFFQSVFSDDPEPSSPESEPDPDPSPSIPSITSAWTFGSTLMKTLASKSESVIETYRRDLEEFSSGIKKETAVILDAVKDLPTSLEAGAGLAQESLESVGQAIDDLGSTVTEIIASSKDSILSIDNNNNNNNNNNNLRGDVISKPYSRLDAQIRMVQSDMNTYLNDPDDVEYDEWKLGFRFDEKLGEIDEVMSDKDGVVGEIYREIVPSRLDENLFWLRYFYRVYKVKMAEEARVKLVKRAISGEEDEELSWDVDEDDYEEKAESGLKVDEKECVIEEDKSLEKKDVSSQTENEKPSEAEAKSDLKTDKDSDITVVSSQPSPEEDGWDEIEDIGSGDENKDKDKVVSRGTGSHGSADRAELQKQLKQLSVAEEEDLTWDIEDDED